MITKEQRAQLRKSAPAGTKLSVSRAARTKRQPPKSVYSGTGNLPGLIRDIFPTYTYSALKAAQEKVEVYAYRNNSGIIPSESDIRRIVNS